MGGGGGRTVHGDVMCAGTTDSWGEGAAPNPIPKVASAARRSV